ncbi:biotin--[acetyl-CoA-carboxylase] ligase [Candidatus Pelagibacter sp. Uisw_099_02]|uniref:biotin--[acetyl-CoA-carboxylase] ligase n=1 Tax=Candidatus Pelagibacter sp. Uisw_099_02 TaxID=3230981 RepID=UPI00236A3CFC|nr:biotin--[acetyl-CoA-carboxylase] ligase [Candidatus Pelagibacter sp.]
MKLKKFNFKIINSTNDLAIKIIRNTNNKSGIVIAEKQKRGRGQYGKKWTSFKGNLFVSIFFQLNKIQLSLKDLTKVNCFLVKKLLSNFYKGNIIIKNPNDLLVNNMKISGILQETISKADEKFIIIGIGVNLIKSPNIKNYSTTNLFDLINVKITPKNASLKLKKIYETFIPMLPEFNIKNLNKNLK